MSISYIDGSGKERQTQTFTGTGVVIAASLYDPMVVPPSASSQ